jgi:hypothetical protein
MWAYSKIKNGDDKMEFYSEKEREEFIAFRRATFTAVLAQLTRIHRKASWRVPTNKELIDKAWELANEAAEFEFTAAEFE